MSLAARMAAMERQYPVGSTINTYDGPGVVTGHVTGFGEPEVRVRLDDGGAIREYDASRVAATARRSSHA